MKFDNFTLNSQEPVQHATDRAQASGHQAIGCAHLLSGVLAAGRTVTQLPLGTPALHEQMLRRALESQLQSLPRVSGGEPYLDREANAALSRAAAEAQKMGDQFVTLEALLLALLLTKSTTAQILKDAGLSEQALRQAIKELRGGQKAASQGSEDTYQALEK